MTPWSSSRLLVHKQGVRLPVCALGNLRGGSIDPPTTGGRGGERAQLTGLLISYYELWRRIFLSIENGQKNFPKIYGKKMMVFLKPPRRADSKHPRFQFLPNFESGSPLGPRVSLSRILGGLAIEPFGGGV